MPLLQGELGEAARRIVARYPEGRERSAILPLLYLVQAVEGRLTREGLREIGGLLGITTAEVEAVATFYTMLRLRPTGRHVVSVCTNLACALRGARDVYEAAHRAFGMRHGQEVSDDGLVTVHEEECLGACDAAPVVQIDFVNHDRVTPERMAELAETLRRGEVPAPSRGEAPRDFRHASWLLAGLEGEPPEGLVARDPSAGSAAGSAGGRGSPPAGTGPAPRTDPAAPADPRAEEEAG
ncbi:MAG TPA: NAD(P)H-dependent oxidoreductase subunit E [Actinomycetota bacterium]|nr:NAD(P)H-dependent oxidoreductase subunit E [Actinomycetota bacterium]